MSKMLTLKRPFIWLRRFRHRCGYGVHSPFAFNLITNVIYEKNKYYCYKPLAAEARKLKSKGKRSYSINTKTQQLLFRLVNSVQPPTIVHIGSIKSTSAYLKSGHTAARFVQADTLAQLPADLPSQIDFLHIDSSCSAAEVDACCTALLARIPQKGCCVIGGIRYSTATKKVWQKWMADEQTGISFDLYDVGIFFFDKQKIKQHYTVNF